MDRPPPTEPMCPRCGYDQSGEAATWEDTCPVEGRCPECGHWFVWADLFDPSRRELPWSVESSGGRLRRLMRTPGMALRMALPWVYWKRVGVDMKVRPGRILGWLFWFAVAIQIIAWPFVFLMLGLATLGRWPLSLGDVGDVFHERSFSELAGIGVDGFGWPVVSVGPDWSGPRFSLFILDFGAVFVLKFILGLCVTWCVVLTAIPVTRRLAKLRLAHIVRAALLQIAPIIPLFAMIRVGLLHENFSFGDVVRTVIMYVTLGAVVWAMVWWVSAIWVGWRIRSVAMTVLGSIAALLGGLVAVYIDDSIWFLLHW